MPHRLQRATLAVILAVAVPSGRAEALDPPGPGRPPAQVDPPMLGIHWARGQAAAGAATSPDLTWHGGAIMASTLVQAIYWGIGWSSATFAGDKVSGLSAFYSQIGGTPFAHTWSEYSGSNGSVGTGVTFAGSLFDGSAAPKSPPRTGAIAAEVCKMITNPVSNGYYPVYVDLKRGHAGYCAWHSYGTCNGVPVTFGFFFNLDGDPGCDPQDGWTTHSQGLAALANVSAHEISETATDPRNGGWWDASGQENADKCAWTFNKVVSFGSSSWKLQGNWSNLAYDGGQTGYANGGCVDGN